MLNILIAALGLLLLLFFGHRALVEFGFVPQPKISLPFVEYTKKTEAEKNQDSSDVDKQETSTHEFHDLVRITYTGPALNTDDVCTDGVCVGDYVILDESDDTIRVDSINCTDFRQKSFNYDSGPFNPETGEYDKIITNWDGENIRTCGWVDIPKNRVLSRESISFATSTKKRIWNYDTFDEHGTIEAK